MINTKIYNKLNYRKTLGAISNFKISKNVFEFNKNYGTKNQSAYQQSRSILNNPARYTIKQTTRFQSSIVSGVNRNTLKTVSVDDLAYFKEILPETGILSTEHLGGNNEDADLLKYNTGLLIEHLGNSKVVLLPTTTEQVSKIVKYCNEKRIGIVPQGGNTGLLGGAIAYNNEVVLSVSKMNKIRSLDTDSGALVCDSGCVLENLNTYLDDYGLIMPLDLGAKGSCNIGGNISTNAGGIRYLKYGTLHGSVLGLEVVLPDGRIIHNLSTLRKDSTGYDIKQLFIGAEGTLGIVTGVSILTAKKPSNVSVALFGLKSFEDVLEMLRISKVKLGEILSAFEFTDRIIMEKVLPILKKANPLGSEHMYYVLMETSGSNREHDEQKMTDFYELLSEKNLIENGILAHDESQVASIWNIREMMTYGLTSSGDTYAFDLSIPAYLMEKSIFDFSDFLKNEGLYSGIPDTYTDPKHVVKFISGFGHMGDGNIHLNVVVDKYNDDLTHKIEDFVFNYTKNLKGSISAEHGIGVIKPRFLHYSKSEEVINIMKKIKNVFDPNGIMNPNKVLPQ
ncbi:hypothetical protein BB558_007324 [Smittium angustum]|uniref:FAD-binding PCMH-type domain-containing protein n=1 Tax=Smittium angustum TaxID=133377 RepID=A0A2U1IVA9_SMIAN|nr:hypothetical protein BB558_007324 [Smittium angustum]